MVDGDPLKVFLATPGDVGGEREVVRACVDEHNRRAENDGFSPLEILGWEIVRGTARRPQEVINELVRSSDFLIVLFKRQWGSRSGSPWGYTSGTEEELFTGLLELGQASQPMRDVWIGFIDASDVDHRIDELRKQMTRNHAIMYESIADTRDLKEKLSQRLIGWATAIAAKVPRHIDMLPSSGRDVLRASNLRLRGEKLIELGQPDAGFAALQEAASLGGPAEELALARYLGRHGQLDAALTATQRAIEFYTRDDSVLYSPSAAEAFAAQAAVLRQQGLDNDAIGRLSNALSLVIETDAYSNRVRCSILDNRGLALRASGDLEGARRDFNEGLRIRREHGSAEDIAQSLVNLARLEVAAEQLDVALDLLAEVTTVLRDIPPTAINANADVLAAQLFLRSGRPQEGVPAAERALALNRQIGSTKGEAISLLILAQLHRALGDDAVAAEYARECYTVNKGMGNEAGMQRAQWIIDQLVLP